MTVLEQALALAATGIPVFPCLENKSPACAGGFKAATRDPDTIRTMFAGGAPLIGVPTGQASGMDVLDLDPRHGSEAWSSKAKLPLTRRHVTRSGGYHVVFRHHPGLRCSAGRIAPGVDVRADGGYIVWWPAAGFRHIPEDLELWPAELLASLAARDTTLTEPLDLARLAPPSIKAAVDLLAALPNPLSASRDVYARVMLAAAGCAQASGDPDGAIADAAIAWAERWEGGGAHDERAKWEDDWSTRDAPKAGWNALLLVARTLIPGYVDPSAGTEFDPLPPLPPPSRRKLFVSSDFKIEAHQAYVVKGLIAPGNVCALVGQPGAGKSTLAPHLAYAVAQGRRVFGLRTMQGRALYLAAEDLKGAEKRVAALGRRYGHSADCAVMECRELREPARRADVLEVVRDFKPALIVLDTIGAAFAGMVENDSQDMGMVVGFARGLAATGAAVLLIHHPAKSGDGTPRGHSVLNGTLDMVVSLASDDVLDADAVVRGQTPKNRNGTTALALAFRKEVIVLGMDCDGDAVTTTLPVEVSTDAERPAKPAKLSPAEGAAMSALHAMLDKPGVNEVSEAIWLETCSGLSSAGSAKDRARSARNVRAKLIEKGLVCIVNGMAVPVEQAGAKGSAGIRHNRPQGIEFVDGDQGDQVGIITDQSGVGVGIKEINPLKDDPLIPTQPTIQTTLH